jgi:hypothetical protein
MTCTGIDAASKFPSLPRVTFLSGAEHPLETGGGHSDLGGRKARLMQALVVAASNRVSLNWLGARLRVLRTSLRNIA